MNSAQSTLAKLSESIQITALMPFSGNIKHNVTSTIHLIYLLTFVKKNIIEDF